ncbi:RHS repeat-associated core domain-containing protein, partial [Proteus vulgaris]|uniref:RHS repeat-associated core domain-containing protein n=1 Tax=Proteus vulgaris TaxID=585 RepID=UPI001FF70050
FKNKRIQRVDYLCSGYQMVQETPIYADGTPAYDPQIQWLYQPDEITPTARYQRGKLHYVVTDHQGTPREIFSEKGIVSWAGRLNTWGQMAFWQSHDDYADNDPEYTDCHFRFAGQYEDKESGLYYNRFRYYDKDTGQYISPDPIGLLGGFNPYGYVHCPTGWIDPFGYVHCPTGWIDPFGLEGCPKWDSNAKRWRDSSTGKFIKGSDALENASPQEIFNYAMSRQGIPSGQYPTQFKEVFTGGNYKYEVRAHGINSNAPPGSNSAVGPIYRIARSKQGINPTTKQGYGWEQIDHNGNWHHTSILKPNSPNYNPIAANNTHIPIP